mmetsp:Transcript_33455/g.54263  ORF Transcript_33455/g.54263 Transcript_33455/m.54263 type:complete len:100 (-) Transcript_33455:1537-1836(-)
MNAKNNAMIPPPKRGRKCICDSKIKPQNKTDLRLRLGVASIETDDRLALLYFGVRRVDPDEHRPHFSDHILYLPGHTRDLALHLTKYLYADGMKLSVIP